MASGLIVAACASDAHRRMYEGMPRPAHQRATLQVAGKRPGLDNVFVIGTVDGKPTISPLERAFYPYAGANSVEVLPGRHTVFLSIRYEGRIAVGELWFDAEGGHAYAARVASDGHPVRFRIEDEAAGSPVGGVLREFSEPAPAGDGAGRGAASR
ncbi:MAG: hypothetical protein JNM82_12200 [Rhodocyclaceae bacterium]|nr:hypothetical protein [Rhodocyclaceae bacterium]